MFSVAKPSLCRSESELFSNSFPYWLQFQRQAIHDKNNRLLFLGMVISSYYSAQIIALSLRAQEHFLRVKAP
jgi:hypothetical protein